MQVDAVGAAQAVAGDLEVAQRQLVRTVDVDDVLAGRGEGDDGFRFTVGAGDDGGLLFGGIDGDGEAA